MWATLVTLVPVGAVLGLVALGEPRPLLEATWGNLVAIAAVALILGPVAVGVLGLFLWLLGVALVVILCTMAVVLRAQRQAAAR